MFDLTGKTALVTGASGGIGGAIAEALHAAGATVALSGTREAPLRELAASLGERAHVVTANLGDPAEVEALARYIREAGLARPAVVGHSLGGLSGLLLALPPGEQPASLAEARCVRLLRLHQGLLERVPAELYQAC